MQKNTKNIILTYGTFDLFHIGHLNLLRRAKEIGGELIVGVSTDNFNLKKNKKSAIPFNERIEIIRQIKYVNRAFPEDSWEQKIGDIEKYNVSSFVIGSDWKGKFDYLKDYCNVIYLERTPKISSSILKKQINNFIYS